MAVSIWRIVVTLVFATLLAYPLSAQVPIADLPAVEGPWECSSTAGVAGIFITANTFLLAKDGEQRIVSQWFSFRVYERQRGKELDAYFSTTSAGGAVFDGTQLIIHFKDRTEVQPFDLDVRFDPHSLHWTGSWSLCSDPPHVVLARPHLQKRFQPSPFAGDWEGDPNSQPGVHRLPATLRITQGDGGELTVWLDRTLSGYDGRDQSTHADQRNGEELKVLSVGPAAIVLQTANPFGVPYTYSGILFGNGKAINGHWDDGAGGSLSAPVLYRIVENRVPSD